MLEVLLRGNKQKHYPRREFCLFCYFQKWLTRGPG